MRKTQRNDEAVSPVIGVILMVAITVLLAAIIAAFVFGMAGTISKTKLVTTTIGQQDQNSITVTYVGGQDAGSFLGANVSINEVMNISAPILPTVGSSVKYYGNFAGRDHVVVIGSFTDGTKQVIMESYL